MIIAIFQQVNLNLNNFFISTPTNDALKMKKIVIHQPDFLPWLVFLIKFQEQINL